MPSGCLFLDHLMTIVFQVLDSDIGISRGRGHHHFQNLFLQIESTVFSRNLLMTSSHISLASWPTVYLPAMTRKGKESWTHLLLRHLTQMNLVREEDEAISKVMDGPRDCHIEWRKSEREKQIPFNITYMWSLEKWYRWTYLQNSNRRTFLVVQWLRIHLPMQGMCVWSSVRKLRSHVPGDNWAFVPQLERSLYA